ncbi:MAG: hypothetical protein JO235_08195 [Chroococcidiopsidaceae cyanobacterium CP_BM_RX_35]|nr:hypothetical protein [Chroococcidiopsidaceae cyanobacterium CP_BM_RX_35]
MIEINNSLLAGSLLKCFNPSLVCYQGRHLLYYRYTPQPGGVHTCIAFVELNSSFQPVSHHCHIHLPKVTDRILTIDDPRAFVWRDELWLLHIQAARYQHSQQCRWSTAIVLARVNLAGQVIQVYVPTYGRNNNYAVADAPPAFEKNWTPVVVEDELYIIYEIHPLSVLKFQPKQQALIPVCYKSWNNHYPTYLSGGTPLICWHDSEYIGLFHTYVKLSNKQRLYSMGFYTVDVKQWCVNHISSQPILTAWHDNRKNLGWREEFSQGNPLVVFPSGIIECGEAWAVSFGWNDCRCYIQLYEKNVVFASLISV